MKGSILQAELPFLQQLRGNVACALGVFDQTRARHVRVRAQLVVVHPAEQVVDRLVGCFANDVPQRHVDGADDGRGVQARVAQVVARAVHAIPDQLDVHRVLTDHELPDELFDHADLGLQVAQVVRVGAARDPFADSRDAFVRQQLQEQKILAADVGLLGFHDHRP